jgi:hypothetical protein
MVGFVVAPSVFIGVYPWFMSFFYHGWTRMHTDGVPDLLCENLRNLWIGLGYSVVSEV